MHSNESQKESKLGRRGMKLDYVAMKDIMTYFMREQMIEGATSKNKLKPHILSTGISITIYTITHGFLALGGFCAGIKTALWQY
jgi:hypothetical protein